MDKNTENKKYEISFGDIAEDVGEAIDIEEEEKSLPKPQSIKDVFINDWNHLLKTIAEKNRTCRRHHFRQKVGVYVLYQTVLDVVRKF